ncbi:MAG: hypothetical protein R2568_09280 [Candidatus Scalindua sp.]|nr:hypothetical protein [Candidatus Scalindua sp.]MDV5166921.1 hypothetical protein [Candidatus Scalindua sp.]
MQSHRLPKNTRTLLFVFITISIITIGAESSLVASMQETKSVRDSSFKSFIKQVNHNYGKQYASHVEKLFKVLLRKEKHDPSVTEQRFLEFDVLKMRETAGTFQTAVIKNGNMISTRDSCKISFTPRERCSIYIFKIETTGKIFPLFPRKEFSLQTNPLPPNRTHFVPSVKKWLRFEKGYGKEAIILSAFTKGSHEIEKLMRYFNSLNIENLPANNEKPKPVNEAPIISKGINGSKKSVDRKLRLPLDELASFTATEYIWEGGKLVKTLWYKRK